MVFLASTQEARPRRHSAQETSQRGRPACPPLKRLSPFHLPPQRGATRIRTKIFRLTITEVGFSRKHPRSPPAEALRPRNQPAGSPRLPPSETAVAVPSPPSKGGDKNKDENFPLDDYGSRFSAQAPKKPDRGGTPPQETSQRRHSAGVKATSLRAAQKGLGALSRDDGLRRKGYALSRCAMSTIA